jgi:transposase
MRDHRRSGHPRGHSCRGRAGSPRRAAGVREFPATAAGYTDLLGWLAGLGTVALVGAEGTGSYGAGLARHLASAGARVVEAARARRDRRRQGKSDPLDAVSAARAALSGGASGRRKAGTGRWRRSGR